MLGIGNNRETRLAHPHLFFKGTFSPPPTPPPPIFLIKKGACYDPYPSFCVKNKLHSLKLIKNLGVLDGNEVLGA